MDICLIKKLCINNIIGKEIIFFDQVTSTNDIAKEYIEKKCKKGLVIISDYQTFGRGTHGRKWHSLSKESILLSIVLYPKKINNINKIINIGITSIYNALNETINKSNNFNISIKKPNDIYLNNKKVSGVLIESATKGNKVLYAVLGIGVNINNKFFSNELKDIATSLYIETKIEYNREDIIIKILNNFGGLYEKTLY